MLKIKIKARDILPLIIPVLIFTISCEPVFLKFQAFRPSEAREKWDIEVWEGLLFEIDGGKGGVFSTLETLIKEKMKSPVIFAGVVEGGAGDEIFLLSPRNTRLRPSVWDKRFIWKKTEEGTNYVFHLYADGKEVISDPQKDNKGTMVSDEEVDFSPGVEYTWDITTCVKICNLSLAASAFDRPTFVLMEEGEEEEVSEWLSVVDGWCGEKADTEREIALSALVLEQFGLYMEEEEILRRGLKDHPDSVTLHLMLSGCLDVMGCPRGAEQEYLKARELSISE
jgi:hypothetical protein